MSQIQQWLRQAQQQLQSHSDTAVLDVELLLADALVVDRSYLLRHPDQVLNSEVLQKADLLLQRRLVGEPIAYLLGRQAFWSLDLLVDKNVLIPRPETELLVTWALKNLPNDQALSIADLGTGSGAIALALASERPQWQITATDFSISALAVAKTNAKKYQLPNVTFIHSDWFAQLGDKKFDAILSNPPYLAAEDVHLNQGDVRFEPSTALSAGSDGLAAIRHIVQCAQDYLLPGGWLIFECGYDQGQAVLTLMQQAGFKQVTLQQDFAGHDRVCLGCFA